MHKITHKKIPISVNSSLLSYATRHYKNSIGPELGHSKCNYPTRVVVRQHSLPGSVDPGKVTNLCTKKGCLHNASISQVLKP
jgi:hypothetical protein